LDIGVKKIQNGNEIILVK